MPANSMPLPLPPRRVRGWLAGGPGAWFGRFFILPHTLIGIGAAGFWIFLLLWVLFGVDLPVVVTGTDTSYSSKHGTTYRVNYNYQAGQETKSDSGSVSQEIYERFKSGSEPAPKLTVRWFALGRWQHAELGTERRHWASLGFFTLWVGFWDSVVGVFVYELWIKPLKVRWLYKHGQAVPGVLTGKRVRTGRSSAYYVTCAFRDEFTGATVTFETEAWNLAAWNLAHEGQRVTVMCSSRNPKRRAVYEFGGYSVWES